jgi:hypothetical protein
MRSGAKSAKAAAHPRPCPSPKSKGFALAVPLGTTTYSFAASLLLNIGLILFSADAVYHDQILIVTRVFPFARKIDEENDEKNTNGNRGIGCQELRLFLIGEVHP